MNIEKVETGAKLSLTGDGALRLFFVGTGSAFAKSLNQTNLLVLKGDDHVLIDCGTKTPQALFDLGCPVYHIRNFFITHTHADHIGGLEEAALTGRYMKKKKPKMFIPEYFENLLWDSALRGGCAFNERNSGKPLTFGDFWEIERPRWLPGYERETWETEIGSIRLKFFRTMHIPDNAVSWEDSFPSFGILINDKVLFSGDTRYDPGLIKEYADRFTVETIFHDCQLFKGGVHAALEELAELPAKTKAKTYLVHYQDTWEKSTDAAKDAGFAGFAEEKTFYVFD
jgi:ribonuclease BN (tRNA processing enzyme)